MGTRSTVHFIEKWGEFEPVTVASFYQQYDGYIEGVGKQLLDTLDKYKLVNEISLGDETPVANGVGELALWYIIDHKKEAGNLYATTSNDSQEYDYYVTVSFVDGAPFISSVKINNWEKNIFEGTFDEFKEIVHDTVKGVV